MYFLGARSAFKPEMKKYLKLENKIPETRP